MKADTFEWRGRRLASLRHMGLVVAVGTIAAGCANIEDQALAAAEEDRQTCLLEGLEEGSENFALCRLIVRLERRIDQVEREVRFIEQDTRGLSLSGRRGW
ncbi:MAG: hypothetical protein ACFB6S_18670 [Geminicoccaceae bacterium]